MRILIFHGYLLRGTGSNIYNASLVRALARMGHEVELVCQERHPDGLALPDAVRVTVPDIHGVLPVYVADRYEGFEAVTYAELDDERRAALPRGQRGGRAGGGGAPRVRTWLSPTTWSWARSSWPARWRAGRRTR